MAIQPEPVPTSTKTGRSRSHGPRKPVDDGVYQFLGLGPRNQAAPVHREAAAHEVGEALNVLQGFSRDETVEA